MAKVENLRVLNSADKVRHYSVVTGKGAISEVTDELVQDIKKFPIGSQYTDTTGKKFYVRTAADKTVADWTAVN